MTETGERIKPNVCKISDKLTIENSLNRSHKMLKIEINISFNIFFILIYFFRILP